VRQLALGLGTLILVAAAAPTAPAFGRDGFHGGFHGGFFHGGVAFGFGLPGCCVFGGPLGYYPPYPYYPYAAYPAYPAYVAPPAAYANPAPTAYSPAVAGYGTPAVANYGAPAASGGDCREYQSTVTIDGRPQRAFGTVCRQPDGSWRVGTR
jgi:hypothetical protein